MNAIDKKIIETLRFLAIDQVETANSGHPGLPMGAASILYTLWKNFLKGSATNPNWLDRDRFVLSAGHGSALLYAILHLFGYEVSKEDLKNFRKVDSITPGHPEYLITPGVETTTGPLGQGFSNAVGMAIAERRLGNEFNTPIYNIIDHYTYVLVGDGDLMEGIASESASLAGHLKLGKLIAIYDSNGITIDGNTDITFTEDVKKRFEAYGWDVVSVEDGNDTKSIYQAIKFAKIDTSKPTLIIVKTVIGYGSPNKAGKSSVHGSPLGEKETELTKKNFGWENNELFFIPDDVKEYMRGIIDKREIERFVWEETLEEYMTKNIELGEKLKKWIDFETIKIDINEYEKQYGIVEKEASRVSSGKILNFVKKNVSNLIGGSADLNSSTKTFLENSNGYMQFNNQSGDNIAFGIREHGMGGIINGIALHGGIRPFGSTFLVFSDYMKPSIRLSALMGLSTIYIFTHDSIGVGEDGPTHQPIEHFMMLRNIPNLMVYRPADYRETVSAWTEILNRFSGPSAIILSRQNLPVLEGSKSKDISRGAYIVDMEEGEGYDGIIIASGSEVSLAIDAKNILKEEGFDLRVISMISWEKYEENDEDYKEYLIPREKNKIISIEMGLTTGWEKYIGRSGLSIGINTFGKSGPGIEIMKIYGFEKERIAKKIREYITK